MQGQIDVKPLWDKVVDRVKMKVIHPTLWRTLEMAVPITAENNEFVVGFAPGDFNMSGHLTTSEHKNAIETALREFSGTHFTLRIIEGDSIQDWLQTKAKDERTRELKDAAYRKREAEAAVTKSWDGLMELVGRRYAALQFRGFPQFRAIYIQQMLQAISETMDVLMPAGSPADELAERSLARVIDKVGTLTETPGALIAFELQRFRASNK